MLNGKKGNILAILGIILGIALTGVSLLWPSSSSDEGGGDRDNVARGTLEEAREFAMNCIEENEEGDSWVRICLDKCNEEYKIEEEEEEHD